MQCLAAHATHPDARLAARLALACLHAQWQGQPPSLGFAWCTEALAAQGQGLLEELQAAWPACTWVGAASVGVLADGAEYIDEPGLALWICDLPSSSFQLFSGRHRLPPAQPGQQLLVHADPTLPDAQELLLELAQRVAPARLFGGVAASRTQGLQLAGAALGGGLSGLLLQPSAGVHLALTQGCQPLSTARRITAAEANLVLELDGQPALPCLLGDLGLNPLDPRAALPQLRQTLMGLSDPETPLRRADVLDERVRVRHLLGLDLSRQALALADWVPPGGLLQPCQRDAEAARRDLRRMATALRAEVEEAGLRPRGALYISCNGRGGAHFGAPHAEARWLRHALGELPTAGFFAGGELFDGRLYGYSGVLALFAD